MIVGIAVALIDAVVAIALRFKKRR